MKKIKFLVFVVLVFVFYAAIKFYIAPAISGFLCHEIFICSQSITVG